MFAEWKNELLRARKLGENWYRAQTVPSPKAVTSHVYPFALPSTHMTKSGVVNKKIQHSR